MPDNCPNCGASLDPDKHKCEYCGRAWRGGPIKPPPTDEPSDRSSFMKMVISTKEAVENENLSRKGKLGVRTSPNDLLLENEPSLKALIFIVVGLCTIFAILLLIAYRVIGG